MSVMKGIGLITVGIFVILVSFSLVLGLTVNNFLYPEIYEESFEDSGVYDYLGDDLNINSGASFIKMPEDGVKGLVNGLLEETLSYMRSEKDELNLTVEVDTEALKDFFEEQVEKLPECLPEQRRFKDMCLPEERNVSEYLDEYLEVKNITLLDSEEINLAEIYGIQEGSESFQSMQRLREIISIFKIILIVLFVLLLLLLLVGFALKDTVRGFFIWTGTFFILSSVVVLTFASIMLGVYDSHNASIYYSFIEPLLDSVVSKAYESLIYHGIIPFFVGLICIFIGVFGIKKEVKKKN